ncbi:gliding motility protein GldL [uncultured Acetobacteroides sp.]|uniref:type IX secretion system motor protein PorL/GldL n=1 Tax=uncultured Acetobacteroides sp. TaxID=1760811 RepID=UPI0029F5752F|nr:gliding motility protein GldL [uncultured Acetobacteroides sp.]
MKGSLDTLVQSEGWKKFMAKLYGWGASAVIVGALFKIMHWKGAGPMLVIGMGTEAVIFFFSAFEPIPEEYDWKLVFPELVLKDEENLEKIREDRKKEKEVRTPNQTGNVSGMVNIPNLDISIDQGSIDKVNKGLGDLANAASKIADISGVTLVVDDFSGKLQKASAGVEELNGQIGTSSKKLGESVDVLSNSFLNGVSSVDQAGNALVEGVKQATDTLSQSLKESASSMTSHFEKAGTTVENTISASTKDLSEKISQSANVLSSSFEKVSHQVLADLEAVKIGNGNQQKNIETLNKNLATLNSIYELQIQETDKHLKNSNSLYQGVEGMIKDIRLSVEETQKFRQSMHALNSNITSLNDVYGNMLTAIQAVHNN